MTQSCLVCNTRGPFESSYIKNVFDESHITGQRKLIEILNELLDKQLDEGISHTKILCKECHRMCSNYDMHKNNMSMLKTKISDLYYNTQEKNTNEVPAIQSRTETTPKKTIKGKFVVPASKLQPVPADFQLNLSKIAALASTAQAQKPLLNLKVTIGNSVLTQSLTTSMVKMVKPVELSNDSNSISIGEWNVNSLPTEIFSNNDDDDGNNNDGNDNGDGNENDGANDGDTNVMEIDEGSSVVLDTQSDPVLIDTSNIKNENTDDGTEYINAANFELLLQGQEESDHPQTIVLDSNSSILQMMSGQKLVYENGEISLVMDENDDDDDLDGQDSNDEESQIELQVSGDEETANAIIAAAQEQGGAFIKVESGEMYRVKSVQSHPSETIIPDTAAQLVARDKDRYSCLVCKNMQGPNKMTFTGDSVSTVEHMKTEHSAKVYICGLCGIVMRNRSEYATHMAEHAKKLPPNPKLRMYDCELCKKRYNSRTLLVEHMNLHTGKRPYACHICEKTFASKYTRQAHLKTHQERPRPYKCKTCGKSFLSQQNLTQHEKTHLGIKSFVCSICKKAFGTQHSLEVHGVVHSGQKTHVCDICEKAFARRAELADHIRIHTGERPFECEVCGAKFSQRSNLHSHRRATHFDDKRHSCPDCPKRFKRRRLLQYHIKAAHTGERPLKCDVCQSTFVYPEHYKKHIRIHNGERPYYCEICGKAFNSRDNRNTHRFVHSDKKPYECLACGASYMRKRMLVAHMNANGHLAESIVVNQPRVTRVNENLFNEKTGEKKIQNAEKDSTEIKHELKEQDDSPFYNVSEGDNLNVENGTVIATINSENFEPQQVTDENGSILQFIQVKMPDGKDGWVALND